MRQISEPRQSENPFMRNVPLADRRDRRDSTCSEHTGGGGGGGAGNSSNSVKRAIVPNGAQRSMGGGNNGGGGAGGHNGGSGGGTSISGKDGSRIFLPANIVAMAPRFQKKYLLDNGLDASVLDKPLSNGVHVSKGPTVYGGECEWIFCTVQTNVFY